MPRIDIPYRDLTIPVKLDFPECMPKRAHPTDAGADLFSVLSFGLMPDTKFLLDTGVAIKIPIGYVGLVVPRSSMGKVRVSIANTVGVIDSDYRGTIKVFLLNEGTEMFYVQAFETRIAQLIIMPIVLDEFTVHTEENWYDTKRGTGGFGSTG
jgi:dUTP pyrophosphatase